MYTFYVWSAGEALVSSSVDGKGRPCEMDIVRPKKGMKYYPMGLIHWGWSGPDEEIIRIEQRLKDRQEAGEDTLCDGPEWHFFDEDGRYTGAQNGVEPFFLVKNNYWGERWLRHREEENFFGGRNGLQEFLAEMPPEEAAATGHVNVAEWYPESGPPPGDRVITRFSHDPVDYVLNHHWKIRWFWLPGSRLYLGLLLPLTDEARGVYLSGLAKRISRETGISPRAARAIGRVFPADAWSVSQHSLYRRFKEALADRYLCQALLSWGGKEDEGWQERWRNVIPQNLDEDELFFLASAIAEAKSTD